MNEKLVEELKLYKDLLDSQSAELPKLRLQIVSILLFFSFFVTYLLTIIIQIKYEQHDLINTCLIDAHNSQNAQYLLLPSILFFCSFILVYFIQRKLKPKFRREREIIENV